MEIILLAIDSLATVFFAVACVLSARNYLITRGKHALWFWFAAAMLFGVLVSLTNVLLALKIYIMNIDGVGLAAITILWFGAAYTIWTNINGR